MQVQETAGALTAVLEQMGYKNVHVFWYGETKKGPVSGTSRKDNLHPFLTVGILENMKQHMLMKPHGNSRDNQKPWT